MTNSMAIPVLIACSAGSGNDYLQGGNAGDNAEDYMDGGDGNANMNGAFADDTMIGGHGNDRLYGTVGADRLWGGGGIDRFWYGGDNDLRMSSNYDIDFDFQHGRDKLDLAAIDAVSGSVATGNQRFIYFDMPPQRGSWLES